MPATAGAVPLYGLPDVCVTDAKKAGAVNASVKLLTLARLNVDSDNLSRCSTHHFLFM